MPTKVEDDEDCPTMSVPDAGWQYYRMGRNSSYEAARRGDLPTIRIGGRLRVVKAAMERKLAEAWKAA
jgi:hypothetical protein